MSQRNFLNLSTGIGVSNGKVLEGGRHFELGTGCEGLSQLRKLEVFGASGKQEEEASESGACNEGDATEWVS